MSQLPSSDEKKILADLAVLFPINAVLHVGTWFDMQAQFYLDIGAKEVIFADADVARVENFQARANPSTNVGARQVVLSEDGADSRYFKASLPAESGLIKPENLQSIWQNIVTLDEETVPTTTLDAFTQAHGDKANWLFVNTINAAQILKGSHDFLKQLDVVAARMIVDPDPDSATFDLSQPVLDSFMMDHDFHPFHQLASRHPGLAQIIYVRDWKTVHNASVLRFREELEGLRGVQAELETRLTEKDAALQSLRSEHSQETLQAREELEGLRSVQAELETRLTEKDAALQSLQSEHSTLSTSREAAEKRRQLSENNLKNMRVRYKAMSQSYRDQTNAIAKIKAELAAAKKALDEARKIEDQRDLKRGHESDDA